MTTSRTTLYPLSYLLVLPLQSEFYTACRLGQLDQLQQLVNDNRDITTLGRGGSDLTAVALAQSLNANVCEIFTLYLF